jgi:glutamine amidotransferase
MIRVGIVDSGISNVGSVRNALDFLGVENSPVFLPRELDGCSHIILPGDGTFPAGMKSLQQSGLDMALRKAAKAGKHILGICLGMQLLAAEGFEFEATTGLGLMPGSVVALAPDEKALPVPQIGWNALSFRKKSRLAEGLGQNPAFYFMQSFVFADPAADEVVATCDYGGPVVAMIERDNVFGFQFHPEKSQRVGLQLLRNFTTLT